MEGRASLIGAERSSCSWFGTVKLAGGGLHAGGGAGYRAEMTPVARSPYAGHCFTPEAPWCTEPLDGARGPPGVAGCAWPERGGPALPFELNEDRRRHIPRRTHKVTNWPAYEAGVRRGGSLTVW